LLTSVPLAHDPESIELPARPAPTGVDAIDPRTGRASAKPAEKLLKRGLCPLRDHVYCPVATVAHRTRQMQPLRFPLGVGAVEDALDAPPDTRFEPLSLTLVSASRHGGFTSALAVC
jgi:hypothetical protein